MEFFSWFPVETFLYLVSILPKTSLEKGDNFYFERELRSTGYTCIAGTDEAGRGPLAGPVVAACVTLPEGSDPTPFLDSKITTLKQRKSLASLLHANSAFIGIGVVSNTRIDAINILQASLLAMRLAVFHHGLIYSKPDFLLVDGKFEVPIEIPQIALIKGESKSGSIAAASIIAKLYRDSLMEKLDHYYPHYSFKSNKGYPTKKHRNAIAIHGPCPVHRLSFKGVKEFVSNTN